MWAANAACGGLSSAKKKCAIKGGLDSLESMLRLARRKMNIKKVARQGITLRAASRVSHWEILSLQWCLEVAGLRLSS
jgi:hypothetical protein